MESKETSQASVAFIHVGRDEGLDKASDTLAVIDIWKNKSLVMG